MEPLPDVASVAAHFAERSRARMMLELLDGSSRPVTRLAQAAGVATSTASEHLARLAAAGLLAVETDGRVRRYRLAGPEVVLVLEALTPLAHTPPAVGLREHTQWQRLRVARSCYDHLAGSLGTYVLAGLVELRVLDRNGDAGTGRGRDDRPCGPVTGSPYVLGPAAAEVFGAVGIDLDARPPSRRPLLRACTDWTEQRHHLAGGLGASVLHAMLALGWVRRRPGRRDLQVDRPEAIAGWLTGQ